jgi:hypothetical protein
VLTFPDPGSDLLSLPPIQGSSGAGHNFTIAQGALIAADDPTGAHVYPPGAPVGDERANTVAYGQAPNRWPWCVADQLPGKTATASQEAYLSANAIPKCPQSVSNALVDCISKGTCYGVDDANKWAVRGAINAGMAVFTYVRSIENTGPPPDYNQCNLLK